MRGCVRWFEVTRVIADAKVRCALNTDAPATIASETTATVIIERPLFVIRAMRNRDSTVLLKDGTIAMQLEQFAVQI